ncbi:receptor-transporting protein 4 isoform X1 [Psammomys obesus]|uniref:receptor-transporting protein 4 isoform X1 n=1 Tax=Psammomys obesus TaxID=48139 RepID=UPI0024531021|nr:receptor-transporting protein 4 isoform X1 [Psammomys obesus]
MLFSDFSPWEQTFQDLIQEEKPGAYWTLQLSRNIVPNAAAVGWRQYQQTVPGRFHCSICKRSWISAQVKILCHMYRVPGTSQGQVLMRIFAQRCQKCTESQFENPEFSTETTKRILSGLVNYILYRYYGHGTRKIPSNVPLDERVPLDGPHDAQNCEACTLGLHGGCALIPKAKLPQSSSPSPNRKGNNAERHSLLHSSPAPIPKAKLPQSSYPSPNRKGDNTERHSFLHSSCPPRSHHSSPQTGNRGFQEHIEPHDTWLPLFGLLAVAALTIIGQLFR